MQVKLCDGEIALKMEAPDGVECSVDTANLEKRGKVKISSGALLPTAYFDLVKEGKIGYTFY